MTAITLNGSLKITFPEGFTEMSREELKQAYGDDVPDRYGMKDTEKHIIFCVYWHKGPSFLSKLADCKSLRDRCERLISKSMRNHDYRLEEKFESTLCGLEVQGFRHSYVLQDIDFVSEVRVIKRDNVCYTLYYYTRKETQEENESVRDEILNSISF